ncbi:MAG TPA: efflux RND transporter periplasmic adaptor subunit, partial [Thermoanaerobaculia bacterium]|nr:efflux RND transporter periplasmic adaptor subunit [Thermoanaerobaculia bacterium]
MAKKEEQIERDGPVEAPQTIETPAQDQERDETAPATKPRRLRWLVAGALAVAVALGGVLAVQAARSAGDDDAAAREQEGEEKDAPIPVEVAEVRRDAVASYISATANLVPEKEVRVLAEWEGRLARLLAEEGQWVETGQVLAELAQGDAPMILEKARVRLENARVAHARTSALADEGLVSPQDREKAAMELGVAKQELAEAEWRIEKAQVRSPFAGQVTRRSAQPGQDVRLGDELFTVAQLEPLVARIYLAEKDVLGLTLDRPVRIALKADESIGFLGRIHQISPMVDSGTGTVKVTVRAVSPPREVRPGAFVRVDVVKEERPDALVVPKQAVVRELQ